MTTCRLLGFLLLAAACSGTSTAGDAGAAGDASAKGDAGTTGGPTYEILVLDPAAAGEAPLAIAATAEKVGVAYFAEVGAGHELRYVEPGKAPQKVASVKLAYGVSLAFDAQGNPVIGYLGGAPLGTYWTESDAALATRKGDVWTTQIIASKSDDAPASPPLATSDIGDVVGLSPSIAIGAANKLFFAWRDIHGGQFPVQDFQHSDLELAEGTLGGALSKKVAVLGGNSTVGHGGFNSLVLRGLEPAIAYSAQPSSAIEEPHDVWFTQRASGKFTLPVRLASVGDTRSGPSLATDGVNLGIAYEDRAAGIMSFLESADGVTWQPPDPVHGTGTGGFFPSLAYDPDSKSPVIAYYVCSTKPAAQICPADEDELRLAIRRADGEWARTTLDAEGAYYPRLTFGGSRLVVAYKDVARTQLKLVRQK